MTAGCKFCQIIAGEIPARAAAFGIPVLDVNGQNAWEVYEAASKAVAVS